MDKPDLASELPDPCGVPPPPPDGFAMGAYNCMQATPEILEGEDLAVVIDAQDTSFAKDVGFTAFAGGRELDLSKPVITGGEWASGVARLVVNTMSFPFSGDTPIDFVAQQLSAPGRWGTCRLTVKKKDSAGYFCVQLPGPVTSGTAFTMTVTAYTKDNAVDTSYAEDCTISHDGAGDLDITSIGGGSWVNGVWTTNSQKYTTDTNELVTLTVTEDGGTKTGSHRMTVGASFINPTHWGGLQESGSSSVAGPDTEAIDNYLSANSNARGAAPTTTATCVCGGEIVGNKGVAPSYAIFNRGYMRFNVAAYKGYTVKAVLKIKVYSGAYDCYNCLSLCYRIGGGYRQFELMNDWGGPITTDLWPEKGNKFSCQPRFEMSPKNSTYFDNRLTEEIPASAINDLDGDYLALRLVHVPEANDCMLWPADSGCGGTMAPPIRVISIHDMTAYSVPVLHVIT